MKVCVYAIAKNEEKFIDRWVDSMSEADEIYVLDTGSCDNTVKKLRAKGVVVKKKKYETFRFDVARNDSMKLLPKDADICVCTDLDEVFTPGWRNKLEKQWGKNTKQAKYRYVWNYNPDGSEGFVFMYAKIHARDGFFWTHPVHEVLKTDLKNYEVVTVDGITLEHHADPTKSRGQYLGLLELSVQEDPNDDRNMHYLGREYMFAGKWKEAIETLKKHLLLPTAKWRDERCASMRFIGRCYANLNMLQEAEFYFKLAICECPNKREAYWELAKFLYQKEKWQDCAVAIYSMENIGTRDLSYISDPECWSGVPYDMLSICNYYLSNKDEAIKYVKKAIDLSPDDSRLKENLKIFENM